MKLNVLLALFAAAAAAPITTPSPPAATTETIESTNSTISTKRGGRVIRAGPIHRARHLLRRWDWWPWDDDDEHARDDDTFGPLFCSHWWGDERDADYCERCRDAWLGDPSGAYACQQKEFIDSHDEVKMFCAELEHEWLCSGKVGPGWLMELGVLEV